MEGLSFNWTSLCPRNRTRVWCWTFPPKACWGGVLAPEPPGEAPAAPFEEVDGNAPLFFENEEDLLLGEPGFLDDELGYPDLSRAVFEELQSINEWMKELERQRTSTMEKNMMEIFDEFKKGVDEKIGQEDYDTRYNLGIAYKEMGLVDEAIQEFLISAKHTEKYFDSAGLLGLCFREKGMFAQAISWFGKALEVGGRSAEEYLAVRYEILLTYRLDRDYDQALAVAGEIAREHPGYRDVADIAKEIEGLKG